MAQGVYCKPYNVNLLFLDLVIKVLVSWLSKGGDITPMTIKIPQRHGSPLVDDLTMQANCFKQLWPSACPGKL